MPAQPTASVAIEWGFANAAADPTFTVLNFSKIGSSSEWVASELDALIDDLGDAWSSTVGDALTSDLNAISVTARQVTTGDAFSVTKTPSEGTWLNVDSGDALNPWECIVCNHASTAPGRRGVGRTYLPGCRQTFVDSSGTVDGGYRATLASQWTAFRIAADSITIPVAQVVYSRTYDEVASILSTTVRPLIGIQRDRRAGSR